MINREFVECEFFSCIVQSCDRIVHKFYSYINEKARKAIKNNSLTQHEISRGNYIVDRRFLS